MITIVCTTPDKPERRAHTDALCAREGLRPRYTTDLDPQCAAVGRHWRPFMAHYLTYLAALRAFLATGHPYALIMEDDLVRVRGGRTVHDAVRNAPPFDILFLEYCNARCEAAVLLEHTRHHVRDGAQPALGRRVLHG